MIEPLTLVLATLAGGALGTMFYGGLWWSIRLALPSQWPALWFILSLLVRTGLTLAGFFVVGGAQWERWGTCMLGFVAARLIVTRLTGAIDAPAPVEASHAP